MYNNNDCCGEYMYIDDYCCGEYVYIMMTAPCTLKWLCLGIIKATVYQVDEASDMVSTIHMSTHYLMITIRVNSIALWAC